MIVLGANENTMIGVVCNALVNENVEANNNNNILEVYTL